MEGVWDFVLQMVPSSADPEIPWNSDSVSDFAADSRVELRDGECGRVQMHFGVERRRHIGGLDVVEGQVNAGPHQVQVTLAVLGAVIAPVGVPLAVGFGSIYPAYGLAHGTAAGLAVHRSGRAQHSDQSEDRSGMKTSVRWGPTLVHYWANVRLTVGSGSHLGPHGNVHTRIGSMG